MLLCFFSLALSVTLCPLLLRSTFSTTDGTCLRALVTRQLEGLAKQESRKSAEEDGKPATQQKQQERARRNPQCGPIHTKNNDQVTKQTEETHTQTQKRAPNC